MVSTPTQFYRVSGSGAISLSAIALQKVPYVGIGAVRIKQVKLTLDANGAASEYFIVDVACGAGAAYNSRPVNQDMSSAKKYLDTFGGFGFLIGLDDTFSFTYTNTANANWGIEIAYSGE